MSTIPLKDGLYSGPDLVSLLILVFLGVILSPLEDGCTLVLPGDLELDSLLGPVGSVLGLPLTALEDGLWDSGELCVRHDF